MIKIALAAALCAAALAAPAGAANLVANGGFEATTNGPGQLWAGYTAATGWGGNDGFNFIFASGTLDTSGSYSSQFNGNLTLWGSNNGGTNVVPASSPFGGNFIVADGAYETEALTQTLTGLNVGRQYDVTFAWAAGQQTGFNGPTTEGWRVGLGSETHDTTIVSNPSHGFQPWRITTLRFTADATSDVLSFLALGTPNGLPPFSLLDGVSATEVPEAATWAMLVAGFGLVGAVARRRRGSVVAA